MGWLLELLLDGIREICSQFIVDMMELVTEMFTELLSCNLSLFEELFSVVSILYKNVILPMGIAIVLLILVWQLFKSMFGKSVNGEEPIELVIRSSIALFFVVAAKPIVNYILKFAGTPYQWVVGSEIKVESFSGFVSALEGVTEALGIGSMSISLLMLIMQFVVAWNYFKMLFIIAERYVLLGVFSYTAPLAFSTGGSKSTNNILASWSKMFGGQVVLIILNAWCMKMFLSGYGNLMASSYGFTKFFVATLCLVRFCKITFKLDSYMASLGVNLGRPSAGMGAMGLIMAVSRALSHIGRDSAGTVGGSSDTGEDASGMTAGSTMTEGFTGPIPMTPGEASDPSMNLPDMSSDGSFDEREEVSNAAGENDEFGYPAEGAADNGSVLEELGVATAEGSQGAGTAPEIRTDTGCDIGRTEGAGSEGSRTGSAFENTGSFANDSGIHVDGLEDGASMDMDFTGIPEYGEESDNEEGRAVGEGGGVRNGEASEGVAAMAAGHGNGNAGIISELGDYPAERETQGSASGCDMDLDGNTIMSMESSSETDGISYGSAGDAHENVSLAGGEQRENGGSTGLEPGSSAGGMPGVAGIISELGDYPVEREISDSASECDMDLDGNTIEGMESSSETGGVSYGSAGDAYGNASLASRGQRADGSSTGRRPDGTAGTMPGIDPFGEPEGILAEVGAGFGTGSVASYGSEPAFGTNGKTPGESIKSGEESTGVFSDMDMPEGQPGIFCEAGTDFETGRIEPYGAATVSGRNQEASGHGMESKEGAVDALSGMALQGEHVGSIHAGNEPDRREAKDGSPGRSGAERMDAGDSMMKDFTSEASSVSEQETAGGSAYMADEAVQDFDTPEPEMHHGMAPMEEMAGEMNYMDAGRSIPSGNRNGYNYRKPVREFREVPKNREELKRRQSRKGQRPTD